MIDLILEKNHFLGDIFCFVIFVVSDGLELHAGAAKNVNKCFVVYLRRRAWMINRPRRENRRRRAERENGQGAGPEVE